MSPRQADAELDSLIDEITVDCHDEDEQLTGFEAAFDEDASFPCPGTIIGEDVDVLSVSTSNSRRELIATCQRGGQRYEVALLDIDMQADPTTSRLVAAYRRWIGA
jgi:hypothetical protein